MANWLSNFSYDIRGPDDAPRLVFLHGLMGSWTNWRKIHTYFDKSFRILSYDQRGHGKSFKPATGYAPEDYAQDLKLILDELGWQKVHIVGHSMGGRNAIAFAAAHPNYVSSLTIEDIAPEGSEENMHKIEGILAKVNTPFADKRVAKEQILGAFDNQVLAQYLYSNITEISPGVNDWRFSKDAVLESVRKGRSRHYWSEWEKIEAPGLLIRGENSDELSHKHYLKMLQTNSNFEGVEIQGAGHWVHFDKSQEFSQELLVFLTKVLNN